MFLHQCPPSLSEGSS